MARRRRYKEPQFPPGPFVLADDEGLEMGPLYAQWFDVLEDGTRVASRNGGRPVFLRITKQKGDVIWTLDGSGKEWKYHMIQLPESVLT